jgi:uncharacterized membrane protein YesL
MAWTILSTAARLFWRRLGLLMLANVLWLGLSLPILTWPAATAGLFYLTRRILHEELESAPHHARLRDFWEGFQLHGVRTTVVSAMNLGAIALILVTLFTYIRSPAEPLRWLVGPVAVIGAAWMAAQLYVYPLTIQRPASSPWSIIREAFLIAISYPIQSISMLVTTLVLTIAAVLLAGPVLLVFFSAMAMLQTVTLRQVLIERSEIEIAGSSGR